MRNRFRYAGLLLVGALALAACEVDDEPVDPVDEPEDPDTGVVDPEAEPEDPDEDVARADADLVIWADDTRTPALQPFAEEFGETEGVQVVIQELPFEDIDDQLITAAPAGEGPDIIIGAHDWLGRLVEAGVVTSIDLSPVEGQLVDVAVEAFTFEEATYGLPYSTENIALIRNTDLVPDAPETWDEVIEVGTQLQEDGEVELPLVLPTEPADPYHKYPIFTAYGGYVFGQLEDGTYDPDDLGIDTEGAFQAGQAFQDWIEADFVSPDVSYDIMIDLFSRGEAAFAMTGPWALPDFEEAGVPYEVSVIPTIEGGTPQPFVGVQGFMVSAFAESQLLAETFLMDYMATEEAQLQLFEADPRPPANQSAFEQVADDPNLEAFGEAGLEGQPMPAIPEMDGVWDAWTDAWELIFEGEDPEQAFSTAAEQIRAAIG